jgi:hypothetical protein
MANTLYNPLKHLGISFKHVLIAPHNEIAMRRLIPAIKISENGAIESNH